MRLKEPKVQRDPENIYYIFSMVELEGAMTDEVPKTAKIHMAELQFYESLSNEQKTCLREFCVVHIELNLHGQTATIENAGITGNDKSMGRVHGTGKRSRQTRLVRFFGEIIFTEGNSIQVQAVGKEPSASRRRTNTGGEFVPGGDLNCNVADTPDIPLSQPEVGGATGSGPPVGTIGAAQGLFDNYIPDINLEDSSDNDEAYDKAGIMARHSDLWKIRRKMNRLGNLFFASYQILNLLENTYNNNVIAFKTRAVATAQFFGAITGFVNTLELYRDLYSEISQILSSGSAVIFTICNFTQSNIAFDKISAKAQTFKDNFTVFRST